MSEAKWKSIQLRSGQSLPVFHQPRQEPMPLAGKPIDIEETAKPIAPWSVLLEALLTIQDIAGDGEYTQDKLRIHDVATEAIRKVENACNNTSAD